MASYHCSVGGGSKNQGGGGAAHAEYIEREGKYTDQDRYEDLEAKGHGNLPEWANNQPAEFWRAADQYERANGAIYREIEVALPRELTPDQRRELVEAFVAQEISEQHAYQWAIHCPKAALEGREQPHAHIMYSERTQDGLVRGPEQYFKRANKQHPERGGCAKSTRFSGGKTAAQARQAVNELRQRWADLQNQHLERHGHNARVDHRSLADQGLERAPERHLGRAGVRRLSADDRTALIERRAAESDHAQAQRDLQTIVEMAIDLPVAQAQHQHRQQQAEAAQAEAQKREWLAVGVAAARERYQAEKARRAEQAEREAREIQEHQRRIELELEKKRALERPKERDRGLER